ncbi:hypothetical protein F1559_000076 [Cyanidiococcus yangmingshanensis]|uniref:Uncharacterized protein n=1 Tax=Cyanidiococcus yangmingshanensis TaxID=2690220 RepID=A0A7J7IH78_9RHOD|nr:hypothetical protein F1559_000076 [Cyanidiococcus yangmingshanensis]
MSVLLQRSTDTPHLAQNEHKTQGRSVAVLPILVTSVRGCQANIRYAAKMREHGCLPAECMPCRQATKKYIERSVVDSVKCPIAGRFCAANNAQTDQLGAWQARSSAIPQP